VADGTKMASSNRDWKLLETPVTQTKQNMEVMSNRDKIAPPFAGVLAAQNGISEPTKFR